MRRRSCIVLLIRPESRCKKFWAKKVEMDIGRSSMCTISKFLSCTFVLYMTIYCYVRAQFHHLLWLVKGLPTPPSFTMRPYIQHSAFIHGPPTQDGKLRTSRRFAWGRGTIGPSIVAVGLRFRYSCTLDKRYSASRWFWPTLTCFRSSASP